MCPVPRWKSAGSWRQSLAAAVSGPGLLPASHERALAGRPDLAAVLDQQIDHVGGMRARDQHPAAGRHGALHRGLGIIGLRVTRLLADGMRDGAGALGHHQRQAYFFQCREAKFRYWVQS